MSNVEGFLAWRVKAVLDGRIDDVMRHTEVPFRLSVAGRSVTLCRYDDISSWLHCVCRSYREDGVRSMTFRIVSCDVLGPAQLRVKLRTSKILWDGAVIPRSDLIYELNSRGPTWKVTALETCMLPVLPWQFTNVARVSPGVHFSRAEDLPAFAHG